MATSNSDSEKSLALFVDAKAICTSATPVRTTNGVKHRYCHVCETEFKVSEDHFKTWPHKIRSRKIMARVKEILYVRDRANHLPPMIEQYVSPNGPWRGQIYEMIGRAVMQEDQALVRSAHERLAWYAHLERTSLLELAIWKFACLTSTDQNSNHEKRSFVEWSRWYENGWKEHKKSHYRCNQVVIVMEAIVPFLQGEGRIYDTDELEEEDESENEDEEETEEEEANEEEQNA